MILYFLAVGDVKGFAFTLGLTTVFDLVVAFLLTAPLLILMSRRPHFASPKLNGLGAAYRVAERKYGRKPHERAVRAKSAKKADKADKAEKPEKAEDPDDSQSKASTKADTPATDDKEGK